MVLTKNLREIEVSNLAGNLLGPKYGVREILHEKMHPWKLYLTGVLGPINDDPDEDGFDNNISNNTIRSSDNEDNLIDNIDDPLIYTPNLNSNSQPSSMGISFLVSTEEEYPKFDICLTWGRYIWHQNWKDLLAENLDDSQHYEGWNNPEKMSEEFYYEVDKKEKDPVVEVEDNLNLDEEMNSKNQKDKAQGGGIKENIPYGGWQREPQFLILKNLEVSPEKMSFDILGSDIEKSDLKSIYEIGPNLIHNYEFQISFRIKPIQGYNSSKNYYKISIYFINLSEKFRARTIEDETERILRRNEYVNAYIFQPQIRINCIENTSLEPFDLINSKEVLDATEDNNLKLLYYKTRPMARGHMCSVIWREIDPERKPSNPKLERKTNGPPFNWLDGDYINKHYSGQKDQFFTARLRTEFIPVIPISAPDFRWRHFEQKNNEWHAQSIENEEVEFLNAPYLAEIGHDTKQLKILFRRFLEEYTNWIESKEDKIRNEFSAGSNYEWASDIAKNNIDKHKVILKRIEYGLDLLYNDFNLRLAFCFANKAISLQFQWKQKFKNGKIIPGALKPFIWHPFQLAFLIMSIPSIIDKTGVDRDIVDIIWIPTGGGKTEAYLGVAALTIGYRRRLGIEDNIFNQDVLENGTYLLSRYTLRLLTIQQYRRATKLITACEYLRVQGLGSSDNNRIIGWFPETLKESAVREAFFKEKNNNQVRYWIWGTTRISIGLWVGGTLTPNRLKSFYNRKTKGWVYGADDALKVDVLLKYNPNRVNVTRQIGDPAQITKCPVCDCILSLPKSYDQNLPTKFMIFPLVKCEDTDEKLLLSELTAINGYLTTFPFKNAKFIVNKLWHSFPDFYSIGIKIKNKGNVRSPKLYEWWKEFLNNIPNLKSLNPDIRNSGYFYLFDKFPIEYEKIATDDTYKGYDFEIRCCNPNCDLNNTIWSEKICIEGNDKWTDVQVPWKSGKEKSFGIPIPAYTIDEQVYRRLPTMLIGTVDKFAQLSYNDTAGTIFGNVDLFHPRYGFFRNKAIPAKLSSAVNRESIRIPMIIDPPEIILQDELHLIEGVLGSMVGIYESMIEELSTRYSGDKILHKVKYIASSATIRAAEDQVLSLFTRECIAFPAPGLSQKDSFFQLSREIHPLEEDVPSRLYVGVCCPGKSSQKPLTHIWGELFQTPFEIKREIYNNTSIYDDERKYFLKNLDRFWTIVGYFNALNELASTRAIYTQEFITWMNLLYGEFDATGNKNTRDILGRLDDPIELSSRTGSVLLPNYFEKLEKGMELDEEDPVNGLLTTSMFGTGVDVSRLGVMVVTHQPKTSASYIQATGRIGREKGGIVVSYLTAKRPRDLDHYEQFSGYHSSLYKNVEPITVSPFAPQCVKITIGPILVGLLRQAQSIKGAIINEDWRGQTEGPKQIASLTRLPVGTGNPDYDNFLTLIDERLNKQPLSRKFDISNAINELSFNYSRWYDMITNNIDLRYNEYCINNPPSDSVVLGDPKHEAESKRNATIRIIFNNSPNSLRGIEAMTTFGFFLKR